LILPLLFFSLFNFLAFVKQWHNQPKVLLGAKSFDLKRATVFCVGYRLSKHKMTRYAKNNGGHGPPGYAHGFKDALSLKLCAKCQFNMFSALVFCPLHQLIEATNTEAVSTLAYSNSGKRKLQVELIFFLLVQLLCQYPVITHHI